MKSKLVTPLVVTSKIINFIFTVCKIRILGEKKKNLPKRFKTWYTCLRLLFVAQTTDVIYCADVTRFLRTITYCSVFSVKFSLSISCVVLL